MIIERRPRPPDPEPIRNHSHKQQRKPEEGLPGAHAGAVAALAVEPIRERSAAPASIEHRYLTTVSSCSLHKDALFLLAERSC